ncbi:MAG: flagellar hook-length control protein FliK [Xanthomonadales bacterium]|nr:flagellar hook-length control protein FliK [Xanthomonadales bacterium]ODU95285.1 MAG: hypothetical protein ABT18_00740 [Rhodanobacter sp. SCN 66-43]OJY83011.1 MAG: hypothetical protein BGP23_08045 [Xanthomonadales bacterium 66-474]
MSSLAIPAPAPATAPVNAGAGAAPASGDGKFGDALRQTRAGPETQAPGRVAGDSLAPRHHDWKSGAGDKNAAKDDPQSGKPTEAKTDDRPADASNVLPIMAAVVPLAPAAMRQAPAAAGKPLPAAATAVVAPQGAAPTSHAPNTITIPVGTQTTAPSTATPDPGLTAIAPSGSRDAEPQADADHGRDAIAPRSAADDFGAQLGQLVAAHGIPSANAAPAPMPLQIAMQATPDQPPQFMQETAQSVAWLAGQGIQKAEIQLNPRTLGPIHVEVSTHNDRVDVSFAVAHPQTVHALQQTLPHLNDMLAQQGLNLGHASVGQQSSGQQHAAFAQHVGDSASGDAHGAEAETPQNWRPLRIATPGRVDDFA